MAREKACAAILAQMVSHPPEAARFHETGVAPCAACAMQHAAPAPMPPAGWEWVAATEAPSVCASHPGFLAQAYVHREGEGETVIAIRGTGLLFTDALANSSNPDDFGINLALEICLASFAQPLAKIASLFARLRLRAMQPPQDRQPPGVTFTGHGIGGGMAAVLAAWFDQPAIVFAQAPLRATALMPSEFITAKAIVEARLGRDDPAVQAMQAFADAPQDVLAMRERRRIAHWHVQGEVMESLRSPATSIHGAPEHEHAIDPGVTPRTVDDAIALHDMRLHAALLLGGPLPPGALPWMATACPASPSPMPAAVHEPCGAWPGPAAPGTDWRSPQAGGGKVSKEKE